MSKDVTQKILTMIGYALLDIQATEKAIRVCIKVAIPDQDQILSGLSERLFDETYEKSTLGQMLTKLRSRASFQPDFEELLQRFLHNRNIFAHHLDAAPGWDLKTSEGLKAATTFMSNLLLDSKQVRLILLAVVNAWRIQSGHHVSDEEYSHFELPEPFQRPLIREIYPPKTRLTSNSSRCRKRRGSP